MKFFRQPAMEVLGAGGLGLSLQIPDPELDKLLHAAITQSGLLRLL